jgi:Dolichyl-phosphate-mannose-protein mannosyltransferase
LLDELRTTAADASSDITVVPARVIARRIAIGALSLALLGVAFRGWLGFGPLGSYNSDESVVGLMALRLLHHGELSTFFWGQPYGGSLEAVFVAPFLAVFGANIAGLRAANFLVALGAPILTWRIARHYLARNVAVAVGIVALFFPAGAVWFGTSESDFYTLTAALGLGAVLLAVNLDEQPARARWWLGLGFVVGLGWWTSPNIGYYAFPLVIWLAFRGHWRGGRNLALASAAAVVGSLPWWRVNFGSSFASVRSPHWAGTSTYPSRVQFFFTHALPYALGVRLPWGGAWVFSTRVGEALLAGAIACLVVGVAVTVRGARPVGWLRAPDLVLLAASPFLYALNPAGWRLIEGRYVYFVASIVPLVLGRIMTRRAGLAAVSALVVLTTVGFVNERGRFEKLERPSTAAIAHALEANGYRTAIAGYWISYQLTFGTSERVIATSTSAYRYRPYVDIVEASSPAYVFRVGDKVDDAWLLDELRAAGVQYRVISAGQYYAVLPATRWVTKHPVR